MSSRKLRARYRNTLDLFTSPLYTTDCNQFNRGDVGRFKLAATVFYRIGKLLKITTLASNRILCSL